MRNFGANGTAANDQHSSAGGRLGVNIGQFFVGGAILGTKNDLTGNDSFKDSSLGGTYESSVVKVFTAVRRFEFRSAKQINLMLGGSVPFGVQEVKFSWNRATMGGSVGAVSIGSDRTNQYAAGYVYNLSKRTRLYSTLSLMRNKGNARFVVPGGPAGAAGASSRGFEFGINHDF